MKREQEREWENDAACSEYGPGWWFSAKESEINKAKAICVSCPVQPQCLEYALVTPEHHGIWGGLDEKERHKLWKARRAKKSR